MLISQTMNMENFHLFVSPSTPFIYHQGYGIIFRDISQFLAQIYSWKTVVSNLFDPGVYEIVLFF